MVPQSPAEESLSDLVAMAPEGVDVVLSSQAWRDYEVPGSPHVVFVDGPSGRIRITPAPPRRRAASLTL